MHSQLLSYLEKNNLLTECQFGYRQNRSTTHATTLLIDGIREEVDKGKLVVSCFIDLSKAFDTISHSQLLAKLKSYGVVNRELLWFTDYLFKRTQIVELDSTRSSEKPLLCGVPQGSILGPLLFLIFFNDVVDHVRYSHILKYADDTIIYVAAKELNEIENALTADFKAIDQYLRDNDLVINMNKGKTEVMLFGTNKNVEINILMYPIEMNR
jgi:retron-type reverse transcriptase